MANCVTKYFTKKGTVFTVTQRLVIAAKITDKVTWEFYLGGKFTGFDDGVQYAVGTWGCDGDENFMITAMVTGTDGKRKNKTFSSKTPDSWTDTVVSPTTQRNPIFNCIGKWVKTHSEYKIYEFPNDKDSRSYVVVWTTDIKKYWGFFKDGSYADYNVYSLGKKPMKIGKWQCDGPDNFMFTSGVDMGGYAYSPKAYYSKDDFVERDIPSEPEQTPEAASTEEPTYDKSKFPLGIGSEGPEVAQLQNYLNRLIPNEPLVVNGRFDVKTADKLKQLQKSLNINK